MPRAAVFHGPGRPLDLVTYSVPEPTGAEVLVRVACCTLCRSDLHTHAGRRIEPTPTVLGHEIVGHIAAFGPAAPRTDARCQALAIGDRITWSIVVGCGACFYCADDLPQKCERLRKYGHERVSLDRPLSGGLSEYVLLVPGTTMFHVPDAIADPVAALANCATATVAATLRACGPLWDGFPNPSHASDVGRTDGLGNPSYNESPLAQSAKGRERLTAVVFGAGVLGLTACAMLRALGARHVIVVDPSFESRERAATFGASAAVTPDQLAPHVGDATSGRGADILIELSGAASAVASALANARIGGAIVLAGSVAPTAAVPIEPEKLVRRLLTIRGVHNYQPRDLGAALSFLAGHGREFPFESLIAAEFSLGDVETAFAQASDAPGRRIGVRPGRS